MLKSAVTQGKIEITFFFHAFFKNLLAGTEALALLEFFGSFFKYFATYCWRVILPCNSILSQH